jgi:hypothetical protein
MTIFIYLSIVGIIGLIGNLFVIIVYWNKRGKHTSALFILILAISDLIVCSVLIPMTLFIEGHKFIISNILFCKAYFFLITSTVPYSCLLMTAIAFDRFFCICMVNYTVITQYRAKIIIVVLIIVSGLLGIIPSINAVLKPYDNSNSTKFNSTGIKLLDLNSSPIKFCYIDADHVYVMPFKYFYDFIFISSVFIISILYIFIYKEIHTRRRLKNKRRKLLIKNSILNGYVVSENKFQTFNIDESHLKKSNRQKWRMGLERAKEVLTFKTKRLDNKKEAQTQTRSSQSRDSKSLKEKEDLMLIETFANLKNNYNDQAVEDLLKDNNDNDCSDSNEAKNNNNNFVFNDLKEKIEASSIKLTKNVSLLDLNKECNNNNNNNKVFLKRKSRSFNEATYFSSKSINNNSNNNKNNEIKAKKLIFYLVSIKDIKLALMLFVVSFLFILFYFPSILATHQIVQHDNLFIIYFYFTNSAINPIIYCFLNSNFRSDLMKLKFLCKT